MSAPNLTRMLEATGPYDPDAMSLEDAKLEAHAFYVLEHGYRKAPKLLTPPERQKKLGMSARPAYGLTLAAASQSGYNVCSWSTAACRAVCVLTTAGKARYHNVAEARKVKTAFLAEHPQAFITLLVAELRAAALERGGIDFRPNVASDLRWERIAPSLFTLEGVRVYDYTKAPAGQRDALENYRLVFSVSERERSETEALEYLRSGHNAAVVFATLRGHELPATWNGFDVIDADTSDSRIDDADGVVVGLRAKGAAIGKSANGFVKEAVAS